MTEPTLAELRRVSQSILDGYPGADPAELRQLAKSYLALTDPEPLTAEHCQEAGMSPLVENSTDLECAAALFCMCNSEETPHLEVIHPSVGTLRLALLQENRE
jgi:hypothetical protein